MIARLLRSFVLLALAVPCSAQILQHADRGQDNMHTVTDGILIIFDSGEEGRWLNQIELYGAAFGLDPEGETDLYIVTPDGELLRKIALPNSILGQNDIAWRTLPIPPIQVPREFGIGLALDLPPVQPNPWGAQMYFRRVEYGGFQQQMGMNVGVWALEDSHSYHWRPGTEGSGLGTNDWMIRAYMGADPEGDPEAADVIVMREGDSFIDRVLAAEGDPLDVITEGRGKLPREEIDAIRLGAVTVPQLRGASVTLYTGGIVEGTLVSMHEGSILIRRSSGDEVSIPRDEARRIAFHDLEPVPIASQPVPEPAIPTANRGWGEEQVLGAPDTNEAGDRRTAWAPKAQNAGIEWLHVSFENAVDIAEVRIRETFNPGAVAKVVAIAEDGAEHLLWEGDDPTAAAPEDMVVTVEETVIAREVKVTLDTTRRDGWNEIDAIELVGKDESRQWATGVTASSSYAD